MSEFFWRVLMRWACVRGVQGLRRPSMPATFRVSRQFAIHEMGKALVATVMRQARESEGLKPRLERVERVSMVPRGRCARSRHLILLYCALTPSSRDERSDQM